jgi:hypothetical protein
MLQLWFAIGRVANAEPGNVPEQLSLVGYPPHEPAEALMRSADLNFHLFANKNKVEVIMANNTLPNRRNDTGVTIIM